MPKGHYNTLSLFSGPCIFLILLLLGETTPSGGVVLVLLFNYSVYLLEIRLCYPSPTTCLNYSLSQSIDVLCDRRRSENRDAITSVQ